MAILCEIPFRCCGPKNGFFNQQRWEMNEENDGRDQLWDDFMVPCREFTTYSYWKFVPEIVTFPMKIFSMVNLPSSDVNV